mgnify:CR=1 FL=1
MENPLLLASKCLYTAIALCSFIFGVVNLVNFRSFIMPYLTLSLFYLFALMCLVMTVISCWLDIQRWYELKWLICNGLVRTFEISFAWC